MKKKLEIGYSFKHGEIRKERLYKGVISDISIMYLSDFHFNKYGENLKEFILESINRELPDLVLFGGDYIDAKSGAKYLSKVFKTVGKKIKSLAILGNHDQYYGVEKIKKLMQDTNVEWVNNYKRLEINGVSIQVNSKYNHNQDLNADVNILLLHEPISRKNIKGKYDLILAGHLHGCQFKFWEKNGYLYPGALFYRDNFLKSEKDGSLYLISKGLGDTLPIRYDCGKEILLIDIC